MRLKVKKDGIFQEVVFKGLQGDKGDQGEKGEFPLELIEDLNNISYILEKRTELETSDDQALIRTIAKMQNGSTLKIDRDLIVNYQVIVDKTIMIDGQGHTFICGRDGADIMLNVKANNVIIKNIKFNENLKGRKTIKVMDCTNTVIENCYFTGYSKEFGYYSTDGAILIDGTIEKITIKDCIFYEFAYQYPNALENLVRCISINEGYVRDVIIDNCTFEKVSQGVVGGCKNLYLTNSRFNYVKDNSVYVNNTFTMINSCLFENGEDEGLVFSGGHYNITNCTFADIENKTIGIKGLVRGLSVSNCTFLWDSDNTTTGQLVVCREEAGVTTGYINTFNFVGNTVRMNRLEATNDLFILNNIDSGSFCDNTIAVRFGEGSYIFRFMGTITSLKIKGNDFKNLRTGGTANMFVFSAGATTNNLVYEGNVTENSTNAINVGFDNRVMFKGYEIDPSVAKIVKNFRKRRVHCNSIPTWGNWYKGDEIRKIDTDLADNIIGWLCVGDGVGQSATWKTLTRTI